MARKNPFENLLSETPASSEVAPTEFPSRGASRSISSTLDDLADKADRLLEGETIVELDPQLIDPSFLRDRIDENKDEFETLKRAIAEDGQNSPILVRPHPTNPGRYMVVFGARRRKVAEALGIKVRAVVKELSDRDHVVAQGQENAARANLSFIERALLAADVAHRGYDSDNTTVLSALSIDKATLSKMLAVAGIAKPILAAIGSAKSIGRDRWYELKTLVDRPAHRKRAMELIEQPQFASLSSDKRFEQLYTSLKTSGPAKKGVTQKPRVWRPKDKGLEASIARRGKGYSLAVKAKDQRAVEFGEYLSERLEELYEAFKADKIKRGE